MNKGDLYIRIFAWNKNMVWYWYEEDGWNSPLIVVEEL